MATACVKRVLALRRGVMLAVLGAIVMSGLAVVIIIGVRSASEPTIAGQPVTAADMTFYRAELGGTPTRSAIFDQVADDRALFLLAKRAGVVKGASSLDALLARRDAVNAARAATAASGGVVYGKVQYDSHEFYGRTMSELRQQTLAALTSGARPRLQVSQGDVVTEFDRHPDQWAASATTYQLSSVSVPWTVDGQAGDAALRSAAASKDPIAAASAIAGSVRGSVSIPAAQLAASDLSPDAQNQLTSIKPGGVLDPIPQRGMWVLLRLDAATIDRDLALRNYATQIKQSLLDQKLDSLVTSTAEALPRTGVQLPPERHDP